ncbi:hypothetical protein [Nonomuraea sp. NPDC049400]|uniref:hypothetical protein n=1 Tax=Nonomuraea sp. NPDC049400 TaxID=3364352 RepID=UPI0037ADD16B
MLRTPATQFHSKEYIQRVTAMFADLVKDMSDQDPEAIARAVMHYTETAVYAAERETARVMSMLGAVLANVGGMSTDAVEPALVDGDRLVCLSPQCGGPVVELDWGWRHNLAEVLGPGQIKTYADVAHYDTARDVYECNTCLTRLSLPPGFPWWSTNSHAPRHRGARPARRTGRRLDGRHRHERDPHSILELAELAERRAHADESRGRLWALLVL